MPELLSIQIGQVATVGSPDATEWHSRQWTTGFFKEPVTGPVVVHAENLDGDGQADLINHGGADKAICVYSAAHYPLWRAELELADFSYGAFGENFTLGGLTEEDVCIGDIYAIGDEVFVQVSQPREPCWKLARRWKIKDLTAQVIENGRTGWYFRVIKTGNVEAGMDVTLLERPSPRWTVAAANQVMHHQKRDGSLAAELGAVPTLSMEWRVPLMRRAG